MTTGRRNFLPLVGVLVCVAAFVSYPLFFVGFPVTRDVPWVNWLLFAVGLALVTAGLVRAFRSPERYRGKILAPISAVLGLGVLGFFVYVTEIASRQMPAAAGAPRPGEKAPDFALPDAEGRPVRLADLLGPRDGDASRSGSWALLIFYRGHW